MNIVVLSGSPRKGANTDIMVDAFAETAREGGRFLLCSNSTALYTGEFLDGWDCGLTESELVQRFHPNEAGWTS